MSGVTGSTAREVTLVFSLTFPELWCLNEQSAPRSEGGSVDESVRYSWWWGWQSQWRDAASKSWAARVMQRPRRRCLNSPG